MSPFAEHTFRFTRVCVKRTLYSTRFGRLRKRIRGLSLLSCLNMFSGGVPPTVKGMLRYGSVSGYDRHSGHAKDGSEESRLSYSALRLVLAPSCAKSSATCCSRRARWKEAGIVGTVVLRPWCPKVNAYGQEIKTFSSLDPHMSQGTHLSFFAQVRTSLLLWMCNAVLNLRKLCHTEMYPYGLAAPRKTPRFVCTCVTPTVTLAACPAVKPMLHCVALCNALCVAFSCTWTMQNTTNSTHGTLVI